MGRYLVIFGEERALYDHPNLTQEIAMIRRSTSQRRALATLTSGALLTTGVIASAPARAETPFEGPVFTDGLSQPVYDKDPTTWVRQEFWVKAPFDSDADGQQDRIHVSLARPKETATKGNQVPTVLHDSPYHAGTLPAEMWGVDHVLGQPPAERAATGEFTPRETSPIIAKSFENTWVPRGFAVAQMESPGSGHSDGCATTGALNESLAAKAVIEWFDGKGVAFTAQQGGTKLKAPTWSTGRVGMTGTSYNGTLPIGAASTGVKNLEAIIPDAAISSWYGYYRSQGAVRAPGGYQGEDADVLAEVVTSRKDRAVCAEVLRSLAQDQDRESGDYTPFWKERNYLTQGVGKFDTPALISHGLRDANVMPDQSVKFYEALEEQGVPHQINLHQGGHGGPPSQELMNRWFTRYLWNHKNGVEKRPKAYVTDEVTRKVQPYATWPLPSSRSVRLHARGDGNALGKLTTGHSAKPATQRVTDDASKKVSALINVPASNNRLAFATTPVKGNVLVTGAPSARVSATFGASRANVTAALVEYKADGSNRVISRGWADPRNATSSSTEKRLQPGKYVTMSIDMQPVHTTVREDSRVGLVVLQSDHEFTVRPPAGTTMDVRVHKTELRLPIDGADQRHLK